MRHATKSTLGYTSGYRPDHAWYIHVPPCCYSIHQGVTTNVQSKTTFSTEPIHDASHTGGNDLLSFVRPCFVPPSPTLLSEQLSIANSTLLYGLVNMLATIGDLQKGWTGELFSVMAVVSGIILVPRFILNLRELYARDLESGHGGDIDTAFGLKSVGSRGVVASAIVFAPGGQNEGLEQGEEIEMEERAIHDVGSSA